MESAIVILTARVRRPGPYSDSVPKTILLVEKSCEHPERFVYSGDLDGLEQLIDQNQQLRRSTWLARFEAALADPARGIYLESTCCGQQNSDDLNWLFVLGEDRPEFQAATRSAIRRTFDALEQPDRKNVLVESDLGPGLLEVLEGLEEHRQQIEDNHSRRDDISAAELAERRRKNIESLQDRGAGIASGEDLSALVQGYQMARIGGSKRRGRLDRLVELVGEELSGDFIRGFKALWRKHPVELRNPESNEIQVRWLAALAGIELEVAEGLDFTLLTRIEAEWAARCALYELNGFPEWFSDLLHAQRPAVLPVLEAVVAREWYPYGLDVA